MWKRRLFAVVAALVLTGVGAWVASSTRARVAAPTAVRVDPMEITRTVSALPAERPVDFTLVFE